MKKQFPNEAIKREMEIVGTLGNELANSLGLLLGPGTTFYLIVETPHGEDKFRQFFGNMGMAVAREAINAESLRVDGLKVTDGKRKS